MSDTANTADQDKVLDRVRKLLNLANDNGATEGERDTALRMAHNLLAKHELDMEDVDSHTREKMDPRGHYEGKGWSMNWAKEIRRTIARLFFVKYYEGHKINATQCGNHFVGRASAATTAMYMSDWIINSILKEGRKLYGHNLSPQTRSFAHGCADKLWTRVADMQREQQREYESSGSALVVVVDMAQSEKEANAAFIKAMGVDLVPVKHRTAGVDPGAYGAGQAFGKGIGLNTQVGNKKGTLRLT